MSELSELQRGLKALITGASEADRSPYLQQVAGSPQLAVLRDIVLWWAGYQIEQFSRLTVPFLKQLRLLDAEVTSFVREGG